MRSRRYPFMRFVRQKFSCRLAGLENSKVSKVIQELAHAGYEVTFEPERNIFVRLWRWLLNLFTKKQLSYGI